MITNKDLSIDSKNGKVTLNGNKYDLGTQGEIDAAVKDVYSVMGQNGAKNLIPYPYYETTKTTNGITFTDNGDGSITVNGTATQNTTFYLTPLSWNNEEIKGHVILSAGGVPFNSNFKLTVETPSGTNNNLQDNGELSLTITAAIKNIRLFVANGTTVDNITIYPMIRLASDTDNTYQPYAKTNRQLTDEIDEIHPNANTLSAPVFESHTELDDVMKIYETGSDDYKAFRIYDKNNVDRYSLIFTGGHIKFLSKAADGTTIVDATLA